jgi:hypothetical protein
VRDQAVFRILYNQGENLEPLEIDFNEVRLTLGSYVLVPASTAGQQGTQPVLARIDNVPIAMMSCPKQEKLNALD